MYELRLYVDEPKLIWQAQRALFLDNLRHMAILGKPLLILAVPMVLLFVVLDAAYGRKPLRPGEAATLTVRVTSPLPSAAPRLEVPEGIAVETPPVRIPAMKEVSWRIRPAHAVSGDIRIQLGAADVTYPIRAGSGTVFRSPWQQGAGVIESVEIPYPDAGWAWIWWFTVVSLATVVVLNFRYGVSF